jgi:dienelactone hydrolase
MRQEIRVDCFERAYHCGDREHIGFVAVPDGSGPFPVVLVSHAWVGRDQFVCDRAMELAASGYIGFAIDNYGEARVGSTRQENAAMMAPLKRDRQLLQDVLMSAYVAAQQLPKADPQRIAIVGYCFGGLCALDLARAGIPLRGAVSFHGLLDAPSTSVKRHGSCLATPRVLILHGYADPMVPPEQLLNFAREMTERQLDWQAHIYGNCVHAFTNPSADDPGFGTVYNASGDRRSWLAMLNFLEEVLQ